jgi:hypothetical protein
MVTKIEKLAKPSSMQGFILGSLPAAKYLCPAATDNFYVQSLHFIATALPKALAAYCYSVQVCDATGMLWNTTVDFLILVTGNT